MESKYRTQHIYTLLATYWISINRRSAVDTTYVAPRDIPQINASHIESVYSMYVYILSVISLLLC